jgi:hypothetical protein
MDLPPYVPTGVRILANQVMTNALRQMPPTTARAVMGAVTPNPFEHPLGP